MERVLLILEIVGAVCALVPTLVSVFCLIKNIIRNKDWNLVKQLAMKAMTTVEEYAKTHPCMTGEDKLNMALEVIEQSLDSIGIKFDTKLVKQVIAYIEEMCEWSKTVNCTCE